MQSLTPPKRSFRRVSKKKYIAIIKLRRVLVNILYKISSDYKVYVNRDKRTVKQLLIRRQNALDRKLVDSLLYYCKFTKSLISTGFEINPSDLYISNKAID